MTDSAADSIDYYHWLLSDWAYLGGVRFTPLAARHGLRINHIPLRLPDVYAASGGVLVGERSWQRQSYRIVELKRWSARLGIKVNIEPRYFPADIDLASCMEIAAQRRGWPVAGFVNAVMAGIWAEDANPADPDTLAALAARAGLDAAALLAEARTEAVQAEYRANTARALAAGVFGSPFYHYAGEMFWGQDRLEMLEETIIRVHATELGRRPGAEPAR